MHVEAIKVENGFLIPFVERLQDIKQEKVLLDITVLKQGEDDIDRFFNRYHIDMTGMVFDREEIHER